MPYGQCFSYSRAQCMTALWRRPSVMLAQVSWMLAAPAAMANQSGRITDNGIAVVILILLVLQTLLIIGLQRSRLHNKRARKSLKESQKALEQRIHERTESLYKINNLLIDEVARHEATGHLLRETKEYLQSMINSMPSIIIGVDAEGYITHWNAAAESNFEIFSSEALGKNITHVLPKFPVSRETIAHIIRAGEPRSLEHTRNNEDDSNQYYEITIYPLIANVRPGAVIRVDDVTLRVTIENLMIQNEKMYSLGEVAAGIAHEINNPLSVILQNVQNITRRLDPHFAGNQKEAQTLALDLQQVDQYLRQRDIYQFLQYIREAGERSANIVTTMLAFSHQGQKANTLIDISQLIHQTLTLNQNLYGGKPDTQTPLIHTDISNNLPPIKGSGPELQQVLLNLLRNARQALGNAASDTRADQAPCIWIRARVQEGDLVIEIQDNGPGMSENVRRHIFEPFFTTKGVGSGTGLGLSVSYFIISERHRGSIEVKSVPGRGSTFIIKLPLNETRVPANAQ
ncbi:sensory box histidine kinase [Cellvibrio japonicus Ueda107]|uniref:histidine kinase n=2 Tax=Cellvibrio japonicus TaxID=155077 RepID=B3PJ72_CELJU|nr:sensory box histidine kinase [Cellvibrio japonicus Ueda107]